MELLSVSVGGFRNLAYTTIELGGITALVSPNNYVSRIFWMRFVLLSSLLSLATSAETT